MNIAPAATPTDPAANPAVQQALEVREAFESFVGQTFFQQMLKAMRSTTGETPYFHGGRAEEVFRGQLDQQLAEEMTTATGDRFARPMFANQFPREAALLQEHGHQAGPATWSDLDQLRRR